MMNIIFTYPKIFLIVQVVACVSLTKGTTSMNYLKQDEIIEGMVFPREITVQLGEDVSIKLVNPFSKQESCQYRSPRSSKSIEVGTENRVTRWKDAICGLILKNVTQEDEGFWRLTSREGNDFIRGSMAMVIVDRPQDKDPMSEEYCILTRPNEMSFPKIGSCEEPDQTGMWTVSVGVIGQSKEIQREMYIEPHVEKIDPKIVRNGTQLDLSCNLMHSERMVQVCRFVREEDGFALHVRNGLGIDGYRYSGRGLVYGDCGVTIEHPTDLDRGLWLCFVKAMNDEGEEKDFGSILDAKESGRNLQMHPVHKKVLITGSSDVIMCQANLPISYCWFQRPNGDIISLTETSDNYGGLSFGMGQCALKVDTHGDEAGEWKCSVGGIGGATFETQQSFMVEVRNTDPMVVADAVEIVVSKGKSFKIECVTAGMHRNVPIDSCHFVTPLGAGFSLDESVTVQTALGEYYYNPNRSLKDGYCSLIVKKARTEHSGTWKCFARSAMWEMEGSDKVQVVIQGGISMAGTGAGLAFGVIFMFVVFGVAIPRIWRRRSNTVPRSSGVSNVEMIPRSSVSSNGSNGSNASNGSTSSA